MICSNIIIGSNVFLSREDDPRRDPEFIAQIQDYGRLKGIAERRMVDHRIPRFSKIQEEILKTELRCIYAKNDPCWGYVKKSNRIVSACINGACPRIKQCNPNYSPEEVSYWTPSATEINAYKDPKKMQWYYLADMISDEEIRRYNSNPKNEGFQYIIPTGPVLIKEKDKKTIAQKYKIDPVTGKTMVAVGYRWVITDNISYESDELVPIWGYVEEVDSKNNGNFVARKKAKKIEKKSETFRKKISMPVVYPIDLGYSQNEVFEQTVLAAITGEINLTDVNLDVVSDDQETIVLLDNPAELAFVSGTLLANEIDHGIVTEHIVRLAIIDDYPSFSDREVVLISDTALEKGCKASNIKAWKALSNRKSIIKLHVVGRDFYNFSYGNHEERWTCRNMYGVTHVCVEQADIFQIENLSDGVYPVSLVEDEKTYMIIKKNGDFIGCLGKRFVDLIDALKESEEISASPEVISGISLKVQDGKIEFLGMGHLKFIEY